jgi:hypothetical protein
MIRSTLERTSSTARFSMGSPSCGGARHSRVMSLPSMWPWPARPTHCGMRPTDAGGVQGGLEAKIPIRCALAADCVSAMRDRSFALCTVATRGPLHRHDSGKPDELAPPYKMHRESRGFFETLAGFNTFWLRNGSDRWVCLQHDTIALLVLGRAEHTARNGSRLPSPIRFLQRTWSTPR